MQRQRIYGGLGLLLALALLTSNFAVADETLYEQRDYLNECCDAPQCDAPCGGCGDACCLNCCSACCGWYAGAEVFWAQPRIKDNNAFSISGNIPGTPPTFTTVTTAYGYDYDITPRIWLGYMDCCGSGFRASWWKYDHDSDPVTVAMPPGWILECRTLPWGVGGEVFSAQQGLQLELADLELTNAFDLCGGCALVSYGIRYVRYESEIHEQVATGAVVTSVGSMSDAFDGVGPTLALEFNRPVNCRWSVYGKMRGTVAMGERDTSATSAQLNAGAPFRVNSNSRSGEEAFAIAELQIGVQWNYCCWFVRGGWQAQYWDDAMEVAPLGQAAPTTLGDIGVHGFNLAVGYAR